MTKIQRAKPNVDRLLLTVVEAADLLGVGRTTLYELLARGELQAVRIGRSRRVPRTAIDDYVDQLVHRDGDAN